LNEKRRGKVFMKMGEYVIKLKRIEEELELNEMMMENIEKRMIE